MDDILFALFFILIAVVIPGGLTIRNCYNLFAKTPKKPKVAFWLTFLIGALLYSDAARWKPLEWCFLVFLYLFDVRPEARIDRQYR